MKINLGAGLKRVDGFLNVDSDVQCNPDFVVNLDDVNLRLPFEDNSVEEVVAHHILEHIGEGFFQLMKELYRVCKPGAIVDVIVPHHLHDVYYGDFTHRRPITVNAMYQLGKKYCLDHQSRFGSNTGHAFTLGVDFEMVWYDFDYDEFYLPLIQDIQQRREAGTLSPDQDFAFTRLMREAVNVATNTTMKLKVVK
jgi:SAM-dependent methyltransferase